MRSLRRFLPAAIAAALILAAVVPAVGQIKLVGPKEVEVGRPFEVSVEGLALPLSTFTSEPPQITWLVLCGEAQVKQRLELLVTMQDGKPVWSAAPYVTVTGLKSARLAVVLIVDTAGGFARNASLEVTCGPPQPDPPPPPPPPPPLPGKRWVILIEESSQRTAALAWVVTSPVVRDYLSKQGHHWRLWDQDRVPTDGAAYLAACEGKTPTLFIVSAGGLILFCGPPPLDPDSFVALVKQHGG